MNHLVNLVDYTLLELILFGLGCFLWIVVYLYVLRNILKQQFVEIPLAIVCGNIVWEFLWSWVFKTDMGNLFQWGYRIWFFMDLYIVYGLFRYGHRQIVMPALHRHTKAIIAFGIAVWLPVLYFYIKIYDFPISHMGAYSGYVLNVIISVLYIPLALRMNDWELFSYPAAWCKAIGNLLINIFCYLHFTDWFLLSLCILTTVFDVIYLFIFIKFRKQTGYEKLTSQKS